MALARHSLAASHAFSQTALHRTIPQQAFSLAPCRRATIPHNLVQRRFQSTTANQQPPRSLPRRALGTLMKYTLAFTFSAFSGAFLTFYLLPKGTDETLLALFSKPISKSETLSSYTAPDASTAQINSHILNSPIAAALRTQPNYTEWRPHMQIPVALRPTNLTGGTLAGPGRIAVPPLMFNDKEGKSMVALFYLGEQLCGHPGIVHGGLLATLLDEGLARCCFPALPNKLGVTASLKIDYRKPARADRYYVLRAETTKVEGRKAWVKGWIEEMSEGEGEGGETPVRVVEAEALFIEPRNAAMMKRLYTIE